MSMKIKQNLNVTQKYKLNVLLHRHLINLQSYYKVIFEKKMKKKLFLWETAKNSCNNVTILNYHQ